jgi:hypothetical protein
MIIIYDILIEYLDFYKILYILEINIEIPTKYPNLNLDIINRSLDIIIYYTMGY